MALATQCPYCRTTFRVAQDQLKLRAGLVRCGNCKEIFNGIEHLLRPDEPAKPGMATDIATREISRPALKQDVPVATVSATPEIPAAPAAASPTTPLEADKQPEFIDFFDLISTPAKPLADAVISPEPAGAPPVPLEQPPAEPVREETASVPAIDPAPPIAEEDPLQRMTLMVLSGNEHPDDRAQDDRAEQELEAVSEEAASAMPEPMDANADAHDPIALAIENLHKKPSRRAKDAASRKEGIATDDFDPEEPSFLKSGRRRQRLGRSMRILTALLSFLLLISLLAQAAYVFRNQIAARLPQTKPLLIQACEILGCNIGLPAQIEAVSIESSELQALATGKDRFVLNVLLRNHSETVQAWPNIELTLNDSNEKTIARRVFVPRDYLPATQEAAKGITPTSEQSIKLFFELLQLKAAGYRVYLFYP